VSIIKFFPLDYARVVDPGGSKFAAHKGPTDTTNSGFAALGQGHVGAGGLPLAWLFEFQGYNYRL